MLALWKKFQQFYGRQFAPKIYEVLKTGYDTEKFRRDCISGITVAVISIPLAMALAIASGVTPAQGLYTAIVAGFFIALLGGSRYQIGGPTGAFVVVIFNVMQNYGYNGLAATMLIAGCVLVISGYLRLGSYIKYIPYPVVVGFTAGIGLSLISTQVKDLLGLKIENVPAEFLPKWESYLANLNSFSAASLVISLLSLSAILYMQIKKPKLPAYLVCVTGATLLVAVFGLDIDTIGNKFGGVPHFLPMPKMPDISVNLLLKVLPSGLTIAFLAGVESLLSATVVDGMSGDNHNSNAELVAEGAANIFCMFFAGVPATGAIARTAANVAAARRLQLSKQPVMYRVHDRPSEEKLKEIKPLLDSLKLKLPDCQALKPEHFNRLIELCRQKDRGAGIDDLVLRLQCQAQYSPQNIGHFGLGLKEYVHFTSPIRRYADLLIHRALVNACSFSPAEEEIPSQRAFAETADHLCTAERAAAAAERDLTARYLSLYLKPLTGTEFEVKISGLTNAGIFVRIESLGAEGLIPMRSLPKDYYTLLDAGSCLKGTENKLKFRLGQKLAVVLCEASPESGGLIFRYAGEDPVREEKPARPSKAKKKKTTKTKNKERKKNTKRPDKKA